MLAEIFGAALYLYLLFCTLWLTFAGLFSQLYRLTFRPAGRVRQGAPVASTYELMRRVA